MTAEGEAFERRPAPAPGYVNVRCDSEEETAAWRWVCLRWRYDGER